MGILQVKDVARYICENLPIANIFALSITSHTLRALLEPFMTGARLYNIETYKHDDGLVTIRTRIMPALGKKRILGVKAKHNNIISEGRSTCLIENLRACTLWFTSRHEDQFGYAVHDCYLYVLQDQVKYVVYPCDEGGDILIAMTIDPLPLHRMLDVIMSHEQDGLEHNSDITTAVRSHFGITGKWWARPRLSDRDFTRFMIGLPH